MDQVEPFAAFLSRVASAQPEQYSEEIRAAAERHRLPIDKVMSEFDRMKSYILSYYEGVTPVSSFRTASGQIVDCVPFEQQPAVRAARAAGYSVDISPPPPQVTIGSSPTSNVAPDSPRTSGFALPPQGGGHSASPGLSPTHQQPQTPPGTVALVRITLERLIVMGTLEAIFKKSI
jgi:hypothetical protein